MSAKSRDIQPETSVLAFSAPCGWVTTREGDGPIDLAGEVELPAQEDVTEVFLNNPAPEDLAAMPAWMIDAAPRIVGLSVDGLRALAARDDLTRVAVSAGVSAQTVQIYSRYALTEAPAAEVYPGDAIRAFAACSALTVLDITPCEASDEDIAALAGLKNLAHLRITSDHVTGSGLAALSHLPLGYVQLEGAKVSGAEISALPPLPRAQAAAFYGPNALTGFDALAARDAFPEVSFFFVFPQLPGDVADGEESPADFAALLPVRWAFAGVDVNGMQLTKRGAERAANRLGVELPTE